MHTRIILLLGVIIVLITAPAQAAPTTAALGGGIVINEIMPSPLIGLGPDGYDTDNNGTVDNLDEYIELYNTANVAIDISGWQLWDSTADAWFTFPSNSIVGPNGYVLVIAAVQTDGTLPTLPSGSLAFEASVGNQIISALGDNIVLLDPDGEQFIQATYSDTPDDPPTDELNYDGFPETATLVGEVESFVDGDVPEGVSLTRSPAGDTNIVRHDALFTVASPGTAPSDVNSPPVVTNTTPNNNATEVATNPEITVQFSQPVTVTVNWFDISCDNQAVNATFSGSGSTYTLTPDSLPGGSRCTVTVNATQVSDEAAPLVRMAADYVFGFDVAQKVDCETDFTFIHTIRGINPQPNILGPVTTLGVVVGDFQTGDDTRGDLGGFFIQTPNSSADSNPNTSEGIFVYDPDTQLDVAIGDLLRVSGNSERVGNRHQINVSASVLNANVQRCEDVADPISATTVRVRLSENPFSSWRAVEGMLITVENSAGSLVVTSHDRLQQHGTFTIGTGRTLYHTATTTPTTTQAFNAYLNRLAESSLPVDDGSLVQYPDPIPYPAPGLTATNTLRTGYTVNAITGTLLGDTDAGLLNYVLHPTASIAFGSNANSRPAAPPAVGGSLQVASLHVDGPCCASGTETTRQRDKLITAIAALNADIVGLIGLTNDQSASIQALVADVNASLGAGTYTYIDTGVIGPTATRNALIYKPGAVSAVGVHAILDSNVDSRYNDTLGIPALAQTFQNTNGERLTVVVTQLAPRTDVNCDGLGDPYDLTGQGECNQTRTFAAQALVDWLASDPTSSGDLDKLILGDLQAYALEPPITTLTTGGYSDLINLLGTGADYTQGLMDIEAAPALGLGYLDHALGSPTMIAQVTDVATWHINADEPPALDYTTSNKSATQVNTLYNPSAFRSASRDVVVIGLELSSSTAFTLIAPTGTNTTAYGNPTYSWPEIINTTSYQLYVQRASDNRTLIAIDHLDPNVICNGGLCTVEPTQLSEGYRLYNGQYRVWIGANTTDWYGPFPFVLNAPPPTIPTLQAPSGTDTGITTLNWTLNDDAVNATWFRLIVIPVAPAGNPVVDQWLSRADLCGVNGTTCTYTLNALLTNTTYQYWLQTYGPGGFAIGGVSATPSWAGPANFTVAADLPQAPANISVDPRQGRPAVTWAYDPDVSWYHVYLGPNPNGSHYSQWHSAEEICDINLVACTLEPVIDWTIAGNPYQVWIQGWGPAGFSSPDGTNTVDSWTKGPDWSFVEQAAGLPTQIGVDAPTVPAPTITWRSGLYTTWYQVYVTAPGSSTDLGWHQAADLGCAEPSTTCSLPTAGTAVQWQNGVTYTVYIRAWGPGGFSAGGIEAAPQFATGSFTYGP